MNIRILDEAEQDLLDGVLFYDAQGQGLGNYFFDSLSADIASLKLFGGIHPLRLGFHCWILVDDVVQRSHVCSVMRDIGNTHLSDARDKMPCMQNEIRTIALGEHMGNPKYSQKLPVLQDQF